MRLQIPQKRAYNSMFRTFISFCVFASINLQTISVSALLAFLEFMAFNNSSSALIANHMSAIKTQFLVWGLDIAPFNDPRIKYFTRAITHSAHLKITLKSIIDSPLL